MSLQPHPYPLRYRRGIKGEVRNTKVRYTPRQYAAALHQAISQTSPAVQEKVLDNFVAVLKENGDIGNLDAIESEFSAYEKEARGIVTAQVTTAKSLGAEQEKKIVAELNEYISGQVELKKKVDEGLIGGGVVKIGDEHLDASLRRNLQDLKKKLISYYGADRKNHQV